LRSEKKILAMCESEAEAATCFARFRAGKSFVVGMIALPLTHAAWPQWHGGGLSLVTRRPRGLARVRKASCARP
jgi:hypothetical protein